MFPSKLKQHEDQILEKQFALDEKKKRKRKAEKINISALSIVL
jgi:hypothetical protein